MNDSTQNHLNNQPPLPYGFAKRNKILVTTLDQNLATVALHPQTSTQAILEVQRHLTLPVKFDNVTPDEFERLLQTIYEQGSGQAQQVVETLGEDLDLKEIARALPEPEDLLESADEAPIIRLINALLAEAIKENASDIHIEPYESKLAIRLRVDGVLRDVLHPHLGLAPLLISRIKVMARLDIAEKRLPQDGRISLRIGGRSVDVRVSTLPASHGERVVLRLLDKQTAHMDLRSLGMSSEEFEAIQHLIQRPHGIILVTGPTGSGKTTSLYAMLTQLNERSRNILTVEDPIEYYLDGVGQTQVNTKVDMSFARGLRAILRQDPDVVMVGEIRDLETAEIAVQASLTGHLVLSTLHTNTAIGAITRLRDMGIESFLLSSSLIGAIAQRLVRKLCPHCKQAYTPDEADLKLLSTSSTEKPVLYRPAGCAQCNGSGYKGRIGIFEAIILDDQLRNMIHENASEYALEKQARQRSNGVADNARQLVLQGQTSLEEILRVTRDK